MVDDQLLISELGKRAGVSVRTIRFYINEGLLPSPQARGRYSVYDEEYLTRIELIKLLKNVYLPLKEIRRMVESLSRDEIETMLHKLSDPTFITPPAVPQVLAQAAEEDLTSSGEASSTSGEAPSTSGAIKESGLPEALDYITRVLQSQAAPASKGTPSAPPPMPAQLNLPGKPLAWASLREVDTDAGASQPDQSESSWRRYTIQPGVELLVSEQVYHLSAPSIHRIVAQVKQLFSAFATGGKNV